MLPKEGRKSFFFFPNYNYQDGAIIWGGFHFVPDLKQGDMTKWDAIDWSW